MYLPFSTKYTALPSISVRFVCGMCAGLLTRSHRETAVCRVVTLDIIAAGQTSPMDHGRTTVARQPVCCVKERRRFEEKLLENNKAIGG